MSLINYTLFQRIYLKAMNPPDEGFNPEVLSEEIRQCNYDLATPKTVQRNVCSYTTKHCYKEINAELEYLKEEGYNFKVDSSKKGFFDRQDDSHVFEIKRIIKMRFKCKDNRCPEFNRDEEKQRKWTSYYGLVCFSFYFEEKKKADRVPLMRFNFKIYGQRCYKCGEWGSGSVIEGDLWDLLTIYSNILQIIMHGRTDLHTQFRLRAYEMYGRSPSLKKRKGGLRMEGRIIGHQKHLCEACAEGVCFGFYKQPDDDSSTGKGEEIDQVKEEILDSDRSIFLNSQPY